MTKQRIAIIGAGFSGLSVLVHLVAATNKPLQILLFERSGQPGLGAGYGTQSPHHLLNVRAGQMGAFADRSDDFFVWLLHNEGYWREQSPYYKHLSISPYGFLPRHLYGLYLADLLKKTLAQAQTKGIEVEVHPQEIIGATTTPSESWVLQAMDGSQYITDYIVISTGVSPTKRFSFETAQLIESKRYFHSIWNKAFYTNTFDCDSVAIIGSGLTAVDALASLYAAKYPGKITVISKHGHFPLAHPIHPPVPLKDFLIDSTPKDGIVLLDEIRNLLACGVDWIQLIDTLRPYTSVLWQSSSKKAKQQFMRHLFSLWNKHRHRMAPENSQMIQNMISSGQLQVMAGNVQNVELLDDQRYNISYSSGKSFETDCVLNCTGPSYDIVSRMNPLITHLLNTHYIQADEMEMGLKLDKGQYLAGNNSHTIFGIGSLLFGSLFETTAVPDLRQQASTIASCF
ncbi:MAG: FAD/NAD(P)-binding protein [Parachlamydiales bacterium]|jgi:uncharacterized NAD(P)/FAD-binding protein YdhS